LNLHSPNPKLIIPRTIKPIPQVATEAGADDVTGRDDGEEGFTVTTSVPAFVTSRRALADAGEHYPLHYEPSNE
jgi:hypothetical protein